MHPLLNKATVFVDGIDHPECVAVHPDGSVWAGGEAGQIYKISNDGKNIKVVADTNGFILGIAFNKSCEWLAICDLNNHCLWRLDLNFYKLTKYSSGVKDHSFNIPNYIVFDNDDNFYVTESGGFREVTGKILKYTSDGKGTIWHNGPFNFANGLALDSDQEFLYVVSSWLPGVERIKINNDHSAGERSVYCTLPKTVPDGIAFDGDGNLLVSCYTPNVIFKVDKNQNVTELVKDWEAHTLSNPTNIAFGGLSFDQLFVASLGRWHILKIDYGKKGMPLVSHKRS